MTPKVEGRLLQSLAISKTDRVLEIGTGCGFLTALLACAAGHVDSVDLYADFIDGARGRLAAHGLENVSLHAADASRGWGDDDSYDAIAVTGSVPVFTGDFERKLRAGGRLFVIVGQPPIMDAQLILRVGQTEWHRESLFETVIPPLLNVPLPSAFRF